MKIAMHLPSHSDSLFMRAERLSRPAPVTKPRAVADAARTSAIPAESLPVRLLLRWLVPSAR